MQYQLRHRAFLPLKYPILAPQVFYQKDSHSDFSFQIFNIMKRHKIIFPFPSPPTCSSARSDPFTRLLISGTSKLSLKPVIPPKKKSSKSPIASPAAFKLLFHPRSQFRSRRHSSRRSTDPLPFQEVIIPHPPCKPKKGAYHRKNIVNRSKRAGNVTPTFQLSDISEDTENLTLHGEGTFRKIRNLFVLNSPAISPCEMSFGQVGDSCQMLSSV